MSFLEIRGLSKAYPGAQALHDITLSVERCHVHALLGENGAGKSTLIRLLSGVEIPDSGTIMLDGQRYAPRDPKAALEAGVTTIYQVFNLLPDRSVMHNILLGSEPRTRYGLIDYAQMRRIANDLLERLHVGYLDPAALVGTLRVGEKQVIEIARALAHDSRLLIMDEPTSALNQTEAEALFRIVETLKASGVTVLYISHRLDEIFRLADDVTVLRDGAHIVTRPMAGVTRDDLIEAMIGRKLTDIFPPRPPVQAQRTPRLEARDLHATGLHGVSFTLYAGEVLGVAGLSGSGKTELGKALYGDLPLTHGSLSLDGLPYRPSPRRALQGGMSYLPEDRKTEGMLQEVNVRRNLTLGVLDRIDNRFGMIDRAEERRIAQTQIDALEIKTPSMEQIALHLSGGNQQKVALGKCLAAEPSIFILMEPTQGIDVGVKVELYRFIAEQAAAGKAVLLVSSELNELLGLAHRILVMRDGRITAEIDGASAQQADVLIPMVGQG
jgi:ABC-type sugar transport system ATPase subunit